MVLAGQALQGFAVLIAGAGDDLRRQCRAWRTLVPVERFEIVADELLVEARRTDADLVGVGRPESRAVRRQHFIHERELPVSGQSELALGVGDDDAARAGV